MNKITRFMFLFSSVFMVNASMPDDAIHPKKINSERPFRFSSAVPPREEEMPEYFAAREKMNNNDSSSNQGYRNEQRSHSQELRRLP